MRLSLDYDTNKIEKFNSVIQAYLVCIGFFNFAIGNLFDRGGMVINISILVILIVCNFKSFKEFRFTKAYTAFIMLVSVFFIVTLAKCHSRLTTSEFLFYFILASIVAVNKCNTEKLLRYTTYVSLLVIPFVNALFFTAQEGFTNQSVEMGSAFGILPIIIAGLIHFVYYRRKSGKLVKICYLVDIFLAFEVMIRANRGAFLSVLIAGTVIFLKGWNPEGGKRDIKTTLRIIIVAVIVIIIAYNFTAILDKLTELLKGFGLSANFIEKTARLSETNDISNGRDYINEYTLGEIPKSLLWGHGLSTIAYNSHNQIPYPHNFILQLLYDGGLLLTVPVLFFVIKAIVYSFIGKDPDENIYLLFYVLITLPKMFFSTDMWTNAAFWVLVAYSARYLPGWLKLRNIRR